MPGSGHNELTNSAKPDDDSVSGSEEKQSPEDVSDKLPGPAKIAFWGSREKKPSEQTRKKTAATDKANLRDRSQEKSDGGLLFFPRRNEASATKSNSDQEINSSDIKASADNTVKSPTPTQPESAVEGYLDRDFWQTQSAGAQWEEASAASFDEFHYDPTFQSDWQKAEQAPWLDPESGVLDDRWNSPIKGEQERAKERAEERARIQERVRSQKLEMPDEPQKSWRSKSFNETAGDKSDLLKPKSYDEFVQEFMQEDASLERRTPVIPTLSELDSSALSPGKTANSQPSIRDERFPQAIMDIPLLDAPPTLQQSPSTLPESRSPLPENRPTLPGNRPTLSESRSPVSNVQSVSAAGVSTTPVPDGSAATGKELSVRAEPANFEGTDKPGALKEKTKQVDSARGANEIRNWYLSKLKARAKNKQVVSPANKRREILSQITPGASSLSTAAVVLVISLLLSVAACICSALNLAPSFSQILPGAAAVGIGFGAFMVYQSNQRFQHFKKQFGSNSSSDTKDLDELGLVEFMLKVQEYELTELREREQTVVDFTDEVLCTLDNRFIIIYANDSFVRQCGFSREELLGKSFAELLGVDEKDKIGKYLSESRSARKEVSFETTLYRRDGNLADLKWSVDYSEGGDCYLCTARDITAIRASERSQRQFLSLLDEDFKLPLTAVQGALSMLRIGAYGTLPEQVLNRAGGIEKTTSQLIRLVSDLVDLERIENGKIELRIDEFPISVLTEQAVDAVQAAADQKNVSLKVSTNRTRISADSERLLRVLVNLLSAGIFFSFESTSLLVEVEEQESSVEIKVKCNGRSLSTSEQLKLFDRSKIGSTNDATISSGVIMGLSVSKGIVEKHGGRLSVQSVEGKGLIIVCQIPKVQRQGVKGSQFG
ncbi:MAG: PAS domain-containing sensor histidine kinase [Candidatus Obscuribacterales bacterium]|jgi:PAS domain S-box-containing protein|nr:PAS domain-containing sensor histidine kinase [Candidatus Obscuribacterales bacterium]